MFQLQRNAIERHSSPGDPVASLSKTTVRMRNIRNGRVSTKAVPSPQESQMKDTGCWHPSQPDLLLGGVVYCAFEIVISMAAE